MIDTGIVAVVALGLAALDWRVTRANTGTPYNGLGAVPGVLTRSSPAPMRYRVLVPWLLAPVPPRARRGVYLGLKATLIAGALFLARVFVLVDIIQVLALAGLIALTLEFDYWDAYVELGAVCLCLSGQPGLVVAGALLWGLSKETAVLAPILGLLAGGPVCGLAGLVGPAALIGVRWRQGPAALYCERWTARAYNAADLRAALGRLDPAPLVSIAWTLAAVGAALWGRPAGPLGATRIVSLAWLVAGWTMARARETRVFLPCALWMVGAIG